MIIVDLKVDGQAYEIDVTNNIVLLGELVINEIKKQIRSMGLVGSNIGAGSYLQRWGTKKKDDGVLIESGVSYSAYLEFGTFTLGQVFGDSFPRTASQSKSLKKKDLPANIRSALPKGMVPFAPVRRVVNNKVLMRKLVIKAFAVGV